MKITLKKSLVAVLLASACPAIAFAQSAAIQILACAPKSREAVAPRDPLQCETVAGARYDSTLAELYVDGWRLVTTAFFSGNQQVLYLEKPAAPPAP